MNCQEVMELMQRHVDGDLSEQETSRMLDHVGHCPDCAAMLQRLINLSRGLEQLPRVVPPFSLVDAILPELDNWEAAGAETADETAVLAPRARRVNRSRKEWIGRLTGVAAVAAVVGLLLVGGPNLFPIGPGSSHNDAASLPAEKKTEEISLFNAEAADDRGPSPEASAKKVDPNTPTSNTPTAPEASASRDPSSDSSAFKSGSGGAASEPSAAPSQSAAPSPSAEPDQAPVTPPPSASNRDRNKGITVPPTEPASPPPTMSITGQHADEEAVSPDGEWRAAVTEGKLQLYRVSDGTLVYESASGEGSRSGLDWKEDSSEVDYTFTSGDGKTSGMSLKVSEMEEKTAP